MQLQNNEMEVPRIFCDHAAMSNQDSGTFQDIGKRLALVRKVVGLSQSAIAQQLNMPLSRWNNYELGVSLIPVREALKLKRLLPGISTDWIYDADHSSLKMHAAAQLEAAEHLDESPVKKRGRPVVRR